MQWYAVIIPGEYWAKVTCVYDVLHIRVAGFSVDLMGTRSCVVEVFSGGCGHVVDGLS